MTIFILAPTSPPWTAAEDSQRVGQELQRCVNVYFVFCPILEKFPDRSPPPENASRPLPLSLRVG